MLAVISCLVGVIAILLISETLWRHNILRGEYQRKFLHAGVGSFAAFWPWLISWQQVRQLGFILLTGVLVNRAIKVFHFKGAKRPKDFGDMALALAIILCASIIDVKLFFTLAILHVALADSLAAVVGIAAAKRWRYYVFKQARTVVGSMAFWLTSLFILGGGVLLAHDTISFTNYAIILLLLPPFLTGVENLAVAGLDNVILPLAVLLALNLSV